MESDNNRTLPPENKVCPFCGEEIKAIAIVCRFCGMNLQSGKSTRSATGVETVANRKSTKVMGTESIIWQGSPSHFAYMGYYSTAGCLALGGVCYLLFEPVVNFAPVLVDFLIAGLVLIWALLDRSRRIYVISTRRTSEKRGIIGKRYSEVNIIDIRNVIVRYGIIDRICGIGNVGISSAASSGGVEVKLIGVCDPDRIREIVCAAKDSVIAATDE